MHSTRVNASYQQVRQHATRQTEWQSYGSGRPSGRNAWPRSPRQKKNGRNNSARHPTQRPSPRNGRVRQGGSYTATTQRRLPYTNGAGSFQSYHARYNIRLVKGQATLPRISWGPRTSQPCRRYSTQLLAATTTANINVPTRQRGQLNGREKQRPVTSGFCQPQVVKQNPRQGLVDRCRRQYRDTYGRQGGRHGQQRRAHRTAPVGRRFAGPRARLP